MAYATQADLLRKNALGNYFHCEKTIWWDTEESQRAGLMRINYVSPARYWNVNFK